MKKLEIIIRPERLDDLKVILNNNNAHGLMITNIMGYGSQKGHKQLSKQRQLKWPMAKNRSQKKALPVSDRLPKMHQEDRTSFHTQDKG